MDLLKLIKENPYVFGGIVVLILCLIGVSAWYFFTESTTSDTSASQSNSSNSLSANNSSSGSGAPVNCVVTYPPIFGPCDPVSGLKTATGTITTYPANGGKPCPSNLTVTEPCDDVDCVVTYPPTFGPCDPVYGLKTATGVITTYPSGNGEKCPPLTVTEPCPVDCVVDYPSTWGPCDPVSGVKTATGTVRTYPMNGGATCPPLTMTEQCSVDCQVQWQNGSCNYNTGTITNQATIVTPSKNGGASCPTSLTSTTSCPKYLGLYYERNYPSQYLADQGAMTAQQCYMSAKNNNATVFGLGYNQNGANSTAVCYFNPNDNSNVVTNQTTGSKVGILKASDIPNSFGNMTNDNRTTGSDGWIYPNHSGWAVKAVYSV